MKEQIYTIPVKEAFEKDCECPFCAMKKELEDKSIAYVLSPSYMEEDVRGFTNEQGFCNEHLSRLYKEGNALGLVLMLESHLKYKHKQINDLLDHSKSPSKKLFSKGSSDPVDEYRRKRKSSCFICKRIDDVFARYLDTFFLLYKKDDAFRAQFELGKGFCLDHFLLLYTESGNHLKGDDLNTFQATIRRMEDENLSRIESELDWFEKKFDYRYAKEPWKNSKDALPRSILKINGLFTESK